MAFAAASSCPGSLSLPELDVPLDHLERWVGRCRECGRELELGYAGLVPVHSPPEPPPPGYPA